MFMLFGSATAFPSLLEALAMLIAEGETPPKWSLELHYTED